MIFNKYSHYYDLLYKDKDYNAEIDYIDSLLKKYSSFKIENILDLGCGTGKHDFYLSQRGYYLTGIDLSEEMINISKKNYPNLEFYKDDVRTLNLKKQFDAIISLFHVASYQTTNLDLINYFKTVSNHLKKHGIFIFDYWYGPAVLTDRPGIRIKRMEDAKIKIMRIAEPEMFANENIVDVNYNVIIESKEELQFTSFIEKHKLRYLFLPEIELILKDIGMEIIDSFKWMSTTERPSFKSWYATTIAKKI